MVQPLRYISARKEFERINSESNLKQGLDKFWLNCGDSKERAKERHDLNKRMKNKVPAVVSIDKKVKITAKTETTPLPGKLSRPANQALSEPLQEEIEALLIKGRWQQVVTLVEKTKLTGKVGSKCLAFQANSLANLGDMERAVAVAEAGLQEDPNEKMLYLVLGIVKFAQNHSDEAEQAFSKALYIDPNFIDAHYHRGLLWINRGDIQKGRMILKLAANLAEKHDETQHTSFYPTASYLSLIDAIYDETDTYLG